jgi:hypothetical protein
MKFVFKWLFRLVLLAVVLAVVFILSLDTILRVIIQHNIRAQTGMEAEIGKFHLGLLDPVVHIENLKLHNPPNFGGTPFLNIPEIHVEYDRAALAKNEIHITLLRFNLGELDIVKNESGQTNLFSLGLALLAKESVAKSKDMAEFKKRTGMDFPKIDVLNVSVGTFKFIDLKDRRNNREQKIDIVNLEMPSKTKGKDETKDKKYAVQSPEDLVGLVVLVRLRSGDFFGPLIAPASLK